MRQKWALEQAEAIGRARADADQQIEEAKRQIEKEIERAQAELDMRVEQLGEQIVSSLLRRRAA